jgi:hypothetical protein
MQTDKVGKNKTPALGMFNSEGWGFVFTGKGIPTTTAT